MTQPTRSVSFIPSESNNNIHVVLVETINSKNVGSVARAMMNLGFSNLHLVRPVDYDPKKAAVMAVQAGALLEKIRFHDDLKSAIADAQEVVGFSAYEGDRRPGQMMFPEWIHRKSLQPSVPTALVFGPEDNGLRAEHVEYCHWLLRIPSTSQYSSFNLAQSVMLALYQISQMSLPKLEATQSRPLPDQNHYFQLDRIVDDVLSKCDFRRENGPKPVPGIVKHLFRRMEMDEHEMRIMLAVFSRIQKKIDRIALGMD